MVQGTFPEALLWGTAFLKWEFNGRGSCSSNLEEGTSQTKEFSFPFSFEKLKRCINTWDFFLYNSSKYSVERIICLNLKGCKIYGSIDNLLALGKIFLALAHTLHFFSSLFSGRVVIIMIWKCHWFCLSHGDIWIQVAHLTHFRCLCEILKHTDFFFSWKELFPLLPFSLLTSSLFGKGLMD